MQIRSETGFIKLETTNSRTAYAKQSIRCYGINNHLESQTNR